MKDVSDVIYIGCDVHSTHTRMAYLDEEGEIIDEVERPTEAKALKRAGRRWPAAQTWAVLEQGGQAYWVAEQLDQVVDQVRICDPMAHGGAGRGDKNDKQDARRLARLLRMGETKHVYRPELDERMLFYRRFRYYERATEQVKRQIQYVKGQLRFFGARIPKRAGYSRRKVDGWIEQCPPSVQPDLWRLAEQVAERQQRKREAWASVQQAGNSYWEIRQFQRIPGFGPVRSHGFSAYVMDPHRFSSYSALCKYCRLAVQRRTSNREQVAPEQLNRAGFGTLKALVGGAVRTAVFHLNESNEVSRFYEASRVRTGSAQNAFLNTQRKLLKTCWGLWKSETEYNPERFNSGTG